MPTTLDFSAWLDGEDLGQDEVYFLSSSLDTEGGVGMWNVTHRNGQTFIESRTGGETLALVSPAAIDAFRQRLASMNDTPELGLEDAYHLRRNMENPRA